MMIQSPMPKHLPNFPHTFHKNAAKIPDILDCHPAEVVEIALNTLQRAGIRMIEWRALLYRRMGVPILVSNYSYLVPDEDLDQASDILERIGLPLSPPSKFLRRCYGDFCEKGVYHRITRTQLPSGMQNIVIYPLSFTTLSMDELTDAKPFHIQPTKCHDILVPRPAAVYASILRMMSKYPRYSRTRTSLESDLSELIGYHLLGLEDGYVSPECWKDMQVERRITNAISTIRQWSWDNEWRDNEEWIGDALAAIVHGNSRIDELPYSS